MPENLSVLFISLVLAIAIWMFVPTLFGFFNRLRGRPQTEGKEENKKFIRKFLTVGAFLLGVFVQLEPIVQTWRSYEASQSNIQLENGLKGLESGDSLARISGINYLTILLNDKLFDPTINWESTRQ